ncbi:MAG: preprotein translocase subunit SecG [Planctomycetaceae bacterium]|nr:preprotein translocase subunit SecG [Planctomycetaceae bacterium]
MGILNSLLIVLLLLTAVFLIVLVLIQRGKGGGLAGAFGGMGGQSAFGTKAGDLFTKITIGVAIVWIVLCVITIRVLGLGGHGPLRADSEGPLAPISGTTAPASTDKKPAGNTTRPAAPAPTKTPEKTK